VSPLEAAKVLYRAGSVKEARGLLENVWSDVALRSALNEFDIFCALIEMWGHENRAGAGVFLDSVISGEGDLQHFWERRNMAEQSTLLEWHGQFAFAAGENCAAFESLTRAASLGRDTPQLWRIVGIIHVRNQELELGLRYLRRGLEIHRQTELAILSGRENALGSFTGVHPLGFDLRPEELLTVLLEATRVAKGQKNLKAVRELVIEMIHQEPGDERLMKIRLLLERAIVQDALTPLERVAIRGSHERQARLEAPQSTAPQRIESPRGFSALFRQ